ncbi:MULTISPECIES: DNA polymerase III subunit gamma/tau [Fusobacterium]|uniref:DNA polymerase III subunit gamma/tau n=1 Tax=Fusobacterium mortiferum ATCC 9817 TaxID=469616 RepID=A0ABM6TWN9_FUSMR|nr:MULTISPECIES: DNA polymerase III subunit gamma/tau [Fusobacterium]AVQ19152.1 DNA polymerase III subunit gamma/tau [Fusobacterium mortiferum ATCC 9817]EEO35411.1 DNA polymerase III, subunit gamma and tau [Fusobacterium mortiferum ATCC 9817]MCF2627576.1 DNA polymerase III subunit gamma/tau [Fusobacterium mortiferum]MCF2699323.1 DNA polymerase III subunit gamma/tau [Fusobacterium mortiferum]MCI7666294.1 DNA polymerase III subunit gamma/tau [Fusobacterium mortiferum]
MHITLYRKYRPKNFEEVAGQKEIVKTIKTSLRNGKTSHAYLFTGPRGVGKTTLARLIAKGVNCLENGITDEPCNRCENCLAINNGTFLDMVEIDAASNRGIDEIRQLKEKINYQPVKGRKKIYIIDEVHMLTKEAFNALLKTLEEPPEHVIFILATTEADKILPTIISRCQRYDFKTLSLNDMKEQLRFIGKNEGVDISDDVLELIYESSGGSVRDAVSILERIMVTCLGEEITLEKSEEVLGVTSAKKMEEFLMEIKEKNYTKLVKTLDSFWNDSVEIELFFKDFAKYCKGLMAKGELEIEKGLTIIGCIFDSLNKFKYEEDKRLVGYVIVDNLMKRTVKPTEIIVERVVEKEITPTKEEIKSERKEKLEGITLEYIAGKWNEIVKEAKREKITLGAFLITAKPYKLEDDILYIGFDTESSFCKEQMENSAYNDVFTEVVRKIINPKLKLKYITIGKKKEIEKDSGDFTKKIVDFFGGEIMV